ncbi:cytochrome c3 family protein [Campylobacter pinnipediorum]|uniref:cytochrome c3 family protein n=1 Tax=Campylobacter pinnipediorum TaxID=1965231 RepID=UPI00084DBB33|nr:NapC/NirT family cytochrome c [Campylobacter pinnipediorum]
MKNTVIKAVVITALVMFAIFFGGYEVVRATSGYPFCGSCHEWDGAIAQTNLADKIHGPSNQKGVGAKCTDCHLPHDSFVNYIFTKAKNGISEGLTTLTKDPKAKDWIANRVYVREKYTFDSSCLNCHNNILKSQDGNITRVVNKMHLKYIEFKGTKNEMKCTECHKYVGHHELGKMLIEQKHKTAQNWDEWKKMHDLKASKK